MAKQYYSRTKILIKMSACLFIREELYVHYVHIRVYSNWSTIFRTTLDLNLLFPYRMQTIELKSQQISTNSRILHTFFLILKLNLLKRVSNLVLNREKLVKDNNVSTMTYVQGRIISKLYDITLKWLSPVHGRIFYDYNFKVPKTICTSMYVEKKIEVVDYMK